MISSRTAPPRFDRISSISSKRYEACRIAPKTSPRADIQVVRTGFNRPAGGTESMRLVIRCASLCLIAAGCAAGPDVNQPLRDALSFHASFDDGVDADFARGDSVLYHAPDWGSRSKRTPGLPAEVTHAAGGGRYGDGLEFAVARNPVIVLFDGDRNVAYRDSAWGGTLSFWLNLDPDEDLAPGFSDPLLITPRNWNDAALFVDFTRDDTPRHFRFAAFADPDVWNPSARDWEEVPVEERPMIEVDDPPFSRDRWTHVAMTFDRFNTGRDDGVLIGYLNGERVGALEGKEQTLTWYSGEAERPVIALGINYVGRYDDLAVFDRSMTDVEIKKIYQLEDGIATLYDDRTLERP